MADPPPPPPPPPPSFKAAVAHADSLKLYEYDVDAATQRPLEDAEHRRMFSFGASPMRLGKSSLGLGLYFTSIVLFVLISFVMTLVMLWSVSNNASSDAFEKSYTLRVPEPVVVDAFGAQKTTERAVLCRRSYEVATPITRLSLGSRCMPGNADGNADERTSLLHCPVECRYVNERGNNTKPVLTSEDLADPCTAVPSCDVNKNGGKCCTLTLLTKEVGIVPKGQSWAIFAHTLVLLLLLLVLDWALALTGSNLNANTATVGDFTIFVDQLPIPAEDCPPEEKAVIEGKDALIEFFAHYGEVAKACHVYDVGKALESARKLEQIERQRDEIEAYDGRPVKHDILVALTDRLYWLVKVGVWIDGTKESVQRARKKLQERFERQKAELQEAIASNAHKETVGEAFIVMNYEQHANNAFVDLVRRPIEEPDCRSRPSIRALMASKAGKSGRSSLRESSSLLKWLTGINHVRVSRAPEPTDYIWANTNVRGLELAWRRVVGNVAVVIVVVLGFLVQQGIETVKNDERDRITRAEVKAVASDSDVSAKDPNASAGSRTSQLLHIVRLRGLTVLAAVVIVTVNLLITLVTKYFSERFERWHVRSNNVRFLIAKLSIAQLLNAAIIPILAAGSSDKKNTWFTRGGLAEEAFYIQISSAILPDLLQLMNPIAWLNQRFARDHARTQAMMNNLVEPREFDIAVRYATAIKSLGLAILYAPILPISYMICFVGFLITYASDIYYATRSSRKPIKYSIQIPKLVPLCLRLLILGQIILAHQVLFPSKAEVSEETGVVTTYGSGMDTTAFVMSLVVWCVLGAGAGIVRTALGISQRYETEDGGTRDLPYAEFLGLKARRVTVDGRGNIAYRTGEVAKTGTLTPRSSQLLDESNYEAYTPFIGGASKHLPSDFIQEVSRHYKLRREPYPADTTLMEAQNPETGGEFKTLPPDLRATRESGVSLGASAFPAVPGGPAPSAPPLPPAPPAYVR